MDVDAREKVTKNLQKHGFNPVLILTVKKLNSLGKPNVIMAIADRVLAVYDTKGSKRKLMESWLNLKQISRKGDKMVLAWSHKKFAFNAANLAVVKTLIEVLQGILLSSELAKIGIATFDVARPKPTPLGFIARLREEARLKNVDISVKFQNELFGSLVYSEPYVNVSGLSDIDSMVGLFFNCLPLSDTIVDISFKSTAKNDVYDIAAQLGKEANELRRIELVGPITQAYKAFVDSWKEGTKKLRVLSFEGSGMASEHMALITDVMAAVKLKGIEFHNAISSDAMLYFYSNFMTKTVFDNLVMLNLDHTKNLDFDLLIPRLSSLMMVSLADCDIEVSFALEKMAKFGRLKVLNLSNNACRVVARVMPTSLHTLYLDSVKWSDQTLGSFISLVAHSRVRLSMAMAMTSDAEWKAVTTAFEECTSSSLVGLNWSSNPVSAQFFNFLSVSVGLESLTLSECFRENTQAVMWLREYVMNQGSLKKLVLRGSKRHFLGQSIATVLSAVQMSRSQIDYLDVSFNQCGDTGISELRKLLLTERRYYIKTVVFDGMEPSNGFILIDFLKEMASIKETKLSFPHTDLLSLRQSGLVTDESFEQVQNLYKLSSDQMDKPFHIFRQNDDEMFPHLVTDEMIAKLMKAPAVSPRPNAKPFMRYGAESLRMKPRPAVQSKTLFSPNRASAQIATPVTATAKAQVPEANPPPPKQQPEPKREPEPAPESTSKTQSEIEPESLSRSPQDTDSDSPKPASKEHAVSPRIGISTDGYNLQDSTENETSDPSPRAIHPAQKAEPRSDGNSYSSLDSENEVVVPKLRKPMKVRRPIANKTRKPVKAVCQITFSNSDNEEETPKKAPAKPQSRPASVRRTGAKSVLGRRSASAKRVVRKSKNNTLEGTADLGTLGCDARRNSLDLDDQEPYKIAPGDRENALAKTLPKKRVVRRAASRSGTPKRKIIRKTVTPTKENADGEKKAPVNKRSQSVQGRRRVDELAKTSPSPVGRKAPRTVRKQHRLSLTIPRRDVSPKPNWQFPISIVFSFDDDRIREAFHQAETQNILDVLMNEQDWEPMRVSNPPRVIKRVVRKHSVQKRH